MKEHRHGQDMEDDMGRACDMYGGEASAQGFDEETWRKQTTWKT